MNGAALRRVLLAVLVWAGVLVGWAGAARPVVIEQKGDLFLKQSSGALKRLTNYGRNYSPAVSPDGKWVAYLSVPEDFKLEGSGNPPDNVWLMDLRTFKSSRIAGQTLPVLHSVSEVEIGAVQRSTPTWTADSRTVVWSEIHLNQCGTAGFLARFDVPSGRLVRTAALVPVGETCFLADVIPGPGGLMASAYYPNVVVVYHPDGSWRAFLPPGPNKVQEFWMKWLNASTLEVSALGGVKYRLDITTGVWKRP